MLDYQGWKAEVEENVSQNELTVSLTEDDPTVKSITQIWDAWTVLQDHWDTQKYSAGYIHMIN